MLQSYLVLFFALSIKEASSLTPITPEIVRRLFHYAISSIYDGLEPKKFALQITDEFHTNGFNCPQPAGNFPDEHNCECFYLCSDKRVSHLQCFPGYAFDSSLGYCCAKNNVSTCYNSLKEEKNTSSTNNKNKDERFHCLSDGAYSDPKNCTKYYICVKNKPIEFNCPDQTKFDKFFKVCLPEKQAMCLDSHKNSDQDQDQKLHSVPKSPQIELQTNEILETGSEDTSTHHLFVAYH